MFFLGSFGRLELQIFLDGAEMIFTKRRQLEKGFLAVHGVLFAGGDDAVLDKVLDFFFDVRCGLLSEVMTQDFHRNSREIGEDVNDSTSQVIQILGHVA